MEVCFDILVPTIHTGIPFGLEELRASWGGEEFYQDPPRFTSVKGISFTKRSLPGHLKAYMPSELGIYPWECLSLDCDALFLWERAVNGADSTEVYTYPLKQFLMRYLSCYHRWVVVFELNCDQIDHVYRTDCIELLRKIEDNLNWKREPEGFLAWHNDDTNSF